MHMPQPMYTSSTYYVAYGICGTYDMVHIQIYIYIY